MIENSKQNVIIEIDTTTRRILRLFTIFSSPASFVYNSSIGFFSPRPILKYPLFYVVMSYT